MWLYLVPTLYWTCTSHLFFILGSIQQICEPSRSMSCLVIKWAKFYCFFLYCTSCTVHLSDTIVHNKGGGRYTVGTAPHHLLSISPLYTPWLVQKGWWCTGGGGGGGPTPLLLPPGGKLHKNIQHFKWRKFQQWQIGIYEEKKVAGQ